MCKRDWIWIAAAAWAIGLAALLCEYFEPNQPVVIGMRTLFGVAATGAISLVLIAEARVLGGASDQELYRFTRLASRWVYILMYTLAMVRVGLYWYEAGQLRPVRPMDDFQFYVGCCVVPLWVVRAGVLAVPFKRFSTAKGRDPEDRSRFGQSAAV